jgi:antitoxin component YwqK of YwqJK toxin-antitoxin module
MNSMVELEQAIERCDKLDPLWGNLVIDNLDLILPDAFDEEEWTKSINDQQKKYTGWTVGYGKNGGIQTVFKVTNGNLDGPAIQWYDNGRLLRQQYYHTMGALLKGVSIEWYESGIKHKEERYNSSGARHGEEKYWHPNGRLYWVRPYIEGVEHGKMTYWGADGDKKEEVHYVRGKKQGPRYYYSPNGKIHGKDYYEDDHRLGFWQARTKFKSLKE